MYVRAEQPGDEPAIAGVHGRAFADASAGVPAEVGLVAALRASSAWVPHLSLVALAGHEIVGHVVCTRAHVGTAPALGLGPLGVDPAHQRAGVGTALVHAVLAAAEASGEPLVCLLGDPAFYARFGFEPAVQRGVVAPDPAWGEAFQVRTLTPPGRAPEGRFRYAPAFAPFIDEPAADTAG